MFIWAHTFTAVILGKQGQEARESGIIVMEAHQGSNSLSHVVTLVLLGKLAINTKLLFCPL